MVNFLDTSAVLNGALNHYKNIYISPLVIQELEDIKTNSKKDESVKAAARAAVKVIINSLTINSFFPARSKIKSFIKKYSFLSESIDHQLLAEAYLLQKELKENINFITSDGCLYLFAKKLNKFKYEFFQPIILKAEPEYCGWKNYTPTPEEFNSLYSNMTENVLNARINEFVKIYEDNQLKDILFWDGKKYNNLRYHDIKNPYTGETIRPLNIEQKMALHILQDSNIKVKLLTSAWGGGKTLLSLNYALEQISKGAYQKLVFIRNNIIAAGTNDIGFLPGDVRDKLSIFSRCIADHVGGEEELDHLMDEGIIEPIPLSHIRGRSLKDSIVFVDECENMDDKLVTLVMSRIEESSELIFCGDVAQIDKKSFDEHNGIRSMLKHLAGNPLFGTVKLVKSERGPVPRLCDLMIPPK